jgi:hypothetical protein
VQTASATLHLIGYLQCEHSSLLQILHPVLDEPVGTAKAVHHEPDANDKIIIAGRLQILKFFMFYHRIAILLQTFAKMTL